MAHHEVMYERGYFGERIQAPPAPIITPEDIEEAGTLPDAPPAPQLSLFGQEPRKTKEERAKRVRKKKKKRKRHVEVENQKNKEKSVDENLIDNVDIEYIQDTVDFSDPIYLQFSRILRAFRISDPNEKDEELEREKEKAKLNLKKVPKLIEDDEDELAEEKADDDKPKISKRKLKKMTRLSVAELKQLVNRPDVVEMHDVTAKDPKMLVMLKAFRNTVSVPRHWCFKRKYLQGKRGIEKPPFDLPDFIKRTGIMEMRAALQEKEEAKTLKAKMRERVRPKMGKIDIDYQKLHDAFFKWQTKPRMTIHGDLYYEGKEFETRLKEKKPGELTDDLRSALGMPVGPNAYKVPPPWLIAMQRYGPPPSYPNLKIAGLNAPIPENCSFGYHAGGWGKPPVDEMGKPLYGDVFGTTRGHDFQAPLAEEEVDRSLWGELESESEESESESESEGEGAGEGEETLAGIDEAGIATPAEGLVTPSGLTSIPTGMETPDMIELRKRKIESEMEGGDTPNLYTVLPERRLDRLGTAMMGSTHVYDMTAAHAHQQRGGVPMPEESRPKEKPGQVELALDPSELDLVDSELMAARYEQTLREQQSHLQKEDLSDMVAEHAAKQKNKRKRQAQQQEGKQNKRYKEFKF